MFVTPDSESHKNSKFRSTTDGSVFRICEISENKESLILDLNLNSDMESLSLVIDFENDQKDANGKNGKKIKRKFGELVLGNDSSFNEDMKRARVGRGLC